MKRVLTITLLLTLASALLAQTPPPQEVPPGATVYATAFPPFPPGMRIQVVQAVLVRNTPSLTGTCGADSHVCTTGDALPPATYGVIQNDPPVLDAGGTYYWERIAYDSGVTGWSSVTPTYITGLTPPQMISGVAFNIVADYTGAALTQAICINDGVNSPATQQLQPTPGGVTGTLLCPWPKAGIGNHKVVVQAVNSAGTQGSSEFQFAVTTAPIPQPPAAPANLRIGPTGNANTATQRFDQVKPGVVADPPKK